MRVTLPILAIAALAAVPSHAAAQGPVTAFDQVNTRLKVGDTVWVTDTQGRETQGRIEGLTPDALMLDGRRTFHADDVSVIRDREHDSVKNGTLIGLGIGGGLGLAWCRAAAADTSPRISTGVECLEGFTVYGGLGTLLGWAIDAAIPGKRRVAYHAPGAPSASEHRRSSELLVSLRANRVTVSFLF